MEDKSTLSKTESIISDLRKSPVKNMLVPLEYGAAFPYLQLRHGVACISVPYALAAPNPITRYVDMYPIRYVITVLWPSGKIVAFEDLAYNIEFADVDFKTPIGTFPHAALAVYPPQEYNNLKSELYGLYDKLFGAAGTEWQGAVAFKQKLSLLLEPSLKTYYQKLDGGFYTNYIA